MHWWLAWGGVCRMARGLSFVGAAMLWAAGTAAAQNSAAPAAAARTPVMVAAPRFFALGDTPYSMREEQELVRLLTAVAHAAPPFVLHIGDIKGGSQPCTDAAQRTIAALFRRQPFPVLYTPGDNEWTDCHRSAAGGYDPLERLAALRQTFFADPAVLRRATLGVQVPTAAYPEIAWFVYEQYVIALLHIVGSNDHDEAHHPRALAERAQRVAANRLVLRQAVAYANRHAAPAVIVAFHANPGFEHMRPSSGYRVWRAELEALLTAYRGHVLVIHGDTHRFRFDQPLLTAHADASRARLWRLEVPGSPFVAGVWVTLTPGTVPPFQVQRQEAPAAEFAAE